ncbi:hypothetical protein M0804_008909 [Polistes exclamans]|nr:hypothetical protein M0804_008909 [Polistes exclamans]
MDLHTRIHFPFASILLSVGLLSHAVLLLIYKEANTQEVENCVASEHKDHEDFRFDILEARGPVERETLQGGERSRDVERDIVLVLLQCIEKRRGRDHFCAYRFQKFGKLITQYILKLDDDNDDDYDYDYDDDDDGICILDGFKVFKLVVLQFKKPKLICLVLKHKKLFLGSSNFENLPEIINLC